MTKSSVEYQVIVHDEDGSLWAEVVSLPGCFASGDSMEELQANLAEAIGLYLSTDERTVTMTPVNSRPSEARVETLVLC